ncbi:MAG: cation-translocating P-type ATPase [Thermoflexales bacterium]|nr:cation-translocating P-type ATPase [Thermoflexales bacterium]
MSNEETQAWHSADIRQVVDELATHMENGLAAATATARLKESGFNELWEPPRPGYLRRVFDQLNNFVVIMLIVASLVSAAVGDWVEAAAIMTIVVLNAVLGVVQEGKAEESLAALKKMAAPDAHVVRDGHRQTVAARELVPGDVVLLEAGNLVPADVRLVESINLKIEEAALTGESVPVQKRAEHILQSDAPLGDRDNSAYMGTIVTYGRGRGIVTATAMSTQIGLIAEMIQSFQEEQTPLQKKLNELGRMLGVAALAICGLVFVVAAVRDTNLGLIFQAGGGPGAYFSAFSQELIDVFIVAVSLAIAAVPEGLAAIVTICLALGMQEMARRHALIRKLPAVETLGSATAICSDKTGTLTQNEMMVVRLYADGQRVNISGRGYDVQGEFTLDKRPIIAAQRPVVNTLLWGGTLCNDADLEVTGEQEHQPTYRMVGDPTEGALVVAAAKAGLWRRQLEKSYPRVAEVPFDSERKRMATIHALEQTTDNDPSPFRSEDKGKFYVAIVKGAPDMVLDLCTHQLRPKGEAPLTPAERQAILAANSSFASEALRVLAVAYRRLDHVPDEPAASEIEQDMVFAGLIGMIDPARPEVKPAIERARRAGIRTAMVTGDYADTARAIASQIGLLRPGGHVLTGVELEEMGDDQLVKQVETTDVFARVNPEHKVRIVEAFKAAGHIVAMTGDGVNDAPALKRANIGVAMGITGTDVSKQTADMVLTDDNYVSIVSAVEQGRIIYSNIRKFVFYLLSCNVAEIAIIFIATLAGWPLPLTAIQLLWMNLLTDGAPALAMGLEKGDPDVMERPPRPVNEPIVNRQMLVRIGIMTVALTSTTLTAFWLGMRWHGIELAETMAFVALAGAELPIAYTARSERYPLHRLGVWSNVWMQRAVGLSIALLLLVIYVPFLNGPFNTVPLGLPQWAVLLPLIIAPALVAEASKWFIRHSEREQEANG